MFVAHSYSHGSRQENTFSIQVHTINYRHKIYTFLTNIAKVILAHSQGITGSVLALELVPCCKGSYIGLQPESNTLHLQHQGNILIANWKTSILAKVNAASPGQVIYAWLALNWLRPPIVQHQVLHCQHPGPGCQSILPAHLLYKDVPTSLLDWLLHCDPGLLLYHASLLLLYVSMAKGHEWKS